MRLTDFDFDLPESLIARHPLDRRTDARLLLVSADGALADRSFRELPGLLQPGDLLVLNDTRVVKARLRGRKSTGGVVEILVERALDERTALAHVRASKTPKLGGEIVLPGDCSARVLGRQGNLFELAFSEPLDALLEAHGEVPLPPYLKRQPEDSDDERYQTVYARRPGAVAAPTAGLHFDLAMLTALSEVGVQHCFVTLHVGAGTFQSLKEPVVSDNRLHEERIELGATAYRAIRDAQAQGGRIVAVGTTSARVLEAASQTGELKPTQGETDLFIRPGYAFRTVDVLLTNFHLPQSSLLMLVCALAGRERMLNAYRHAVSERYRFFSYGDAMLIVADRGAP